MEEKWLEVMTEMFSKRLIDGDNIFKDCGMGYVTSIEKKILHKDLLYHPFLSRTLKLDSDKYSHLDIVFPKISSF